MNKEFWKAALNRALGTPLQTGLSYNYDCCSKMAATTLYPTVTLVLMDTDGKIYENEHLTTAYVPEE